MSLLIKSVGPFKSGTTTWYSRSLKLAELLNNTYNINTTVCRHKHDIHIIKDYQKKNLFDKYIILLSVRNEKDIYPSAYFEDLSVKGYEYFLSDDQNVISNKSTKDLYDHFMKFDWTKYEHTNYHTYVKFIYDLFKAEPQYKLSFLHNSNTVLIVYPFEYINNPFKLQSVLNTTFNLLNINVKLTPETCVDIIDDKQHMSSYKWYGDIYKNFIDYLKNDKVYQEKYQNSKDFKSLFLKISSER